MQPASLYPGNAPAYLGALPSGVAGTRATLRLMVKIARAGKVDSGVRKLAQSITRPLAEKDYIGEVRALHRYVRDRVRYVGDVRGVETLQTPQRTLETGSGDCDDKAILLGALLESIDHPARFLALGFKGEGYSHVIVETRVSNAQRSGWLPLETIVPGVEAGWSPPNPTRWMVAHI